MGKRIAIIQGHPDASPQRYCRQLQERYTSAAKAAGHQIDVIDVAGMDIAFLRSKSAFETELAPPDIQKAQEILRLADHLLIIFPLWLGDMPAMLKAFFEQTFRPGFAYRGGMADGKFELLLKNKSAHVVVTMGMPAIIYRLYFGAHGVKNLRRNILRFSGITPVRESLIGLIENENPKLRTKWLARFEVFGCQGE